MFEINSDQMLILEMRMWSTGLPCSWPRAAAKVLEMLVECAEEDAGKVPKKQE